MPSSHIVHSESGDGPSRSGWNYSRARGQVPTYPGSSVMQKEKRYAPRVPSQRDPHAHSSNRGSGHALSNKLYHSTQGYGPVKPAYTKSHLQDSAQQREFEQHRKTYAEKQEARRGAPVRARSPSREARIQYPSQR